MYIITDKKKKKKRQTDNELIFPLHREAQEN